MNKIIKVSLPIMSVAIAIGVVFAIPKEVEVVHQPTVQRVVATKKVEVVKVAEVMEENKAAEVTEPVIEQPVEVVTVKSSQEYAEHYLDLSGYNQVCFDIITQEDIPYRFIESVREHNIKKLALAWPAQCSSRIIVRESNGVVTRHFSFFEGNDTYFDN